MKRKLVWMLVGLGVLLASFSLTNIVNENLGLQDKVQSCFKRYTKGVVYSDYTVGLSKKIEDDAREAITTEQIACSMARLGFDGRLASQMELKKQGRLDNERFAIVWNVRDTLECLDPQTAPTNSTNDLSDVNIFSDCTNTKVASSELRVFLKDYR